MLVYQQQQKIKKKKKKKCNKHLIQLDSIMK